MILTTILVLFVLVLDYEDKALEKPLKLVLKVGGSEVTELSGSGHDSSYYDDRSDHERERHKEKKKKKKKKSEKDKDKYVDDEERRRRKVGLKNALQVSNYCGHSLFIFLQKNKLVFNPTRKKRGRRENENRMNQKQQQLLHLLLVYPLNLSHCPKLLVYH